MFYYTISSKNIGKRDLFHLTETLFLGFEKRRRQFFLDIYKSPLADEDKLWLYEAFPTVESLGELLTKYEADQKIKIQWPLKPDSLWLFDTLVRLLTTPAITDPTPHKLALLAALLKNTRFKQIFKHVDLRGVLSPSINSNLVRQEDTPGILCIFEDDVEKADINLSRFLRNWAHYVDSADSFLKDLYKIPMPLSDFYLLVAGLHVHVFERVPPYYINNIVALSQHTRPLRLSSGTHKLLGTISKAVYAQTALDAPAELKALLRQIGTSLSYFGLQKLFKPLA